jgi:hypothetical protein
MLVNLLNEAPRTEPLLRIYDTYMSFNSHAAELLGLEDGDKVYIGKDERAYNNLYVGKARFKQSYELSRRGKSYVLYNRPLARAVANQLEGKGTYRICPEDRQEDGLGNKFYNIFKKKYGN